MGLKSFSKLFWPSLLLVYSLLAFVIADIAYATITEIKSRSASEHTEKQLKGAVASLMPHASPGHSLDRLFANALTDEKTADRKQRSGQEAADRFAGIRRAFPGKIRLFVIENNGEICNSLSDKIDAKHFLLRSCRFFDSVSTLLAGRQTPDRNAIEKLQNELRFLKPYLGNLLTWQTVVGATQPRPISRLMLAKNTSADAFVWYGRYNGQRLIAFVHNAVVQSFWGLKNLAGHQNRTGSIKIGYGSGPDNIVAFGSTDGSLCSQLQASLFELAASGRDYIEKPGFCIATGRAETGMLMFSWVPSVGVLVDPASEQKNFRRFLAFLFCLIAAAAVIAGLSAGRRFVSIRLEMAFLFFLASLLPALIISMQGIAFLAYGHEALRTSVQKEIEGLISEYDRDFNGLPERLKIEMDRLQAQSLSDVSQTSELAIAPIGIVKNIAALKPDILFLVASDGKVLQSCDDAWIEDSSSGRLYGQLGFEMLSMLNGRKKDRAAKKTLTEQFAEISPGKTAAFLRLNGLSPMLLFGRQAMFTYLLPPPGRDGLTGHIILAGWTLDRLYQLYLQDSFDMFKSRNAQFECFAITGADAMRLKLPFRSIMNANAVRWSDVAWAGQTWTGAGISGRQMPGVAFIMLYPEPFLKKTSSRKSLLIFFIVAGFMLMSLFLAAGFAREILGPVSDLAKAVEAVRLRDFSFQITDLPQNEFGELGKVFNLTISGLKELQVAEGVKKSILADFPEEAGNLKIKASIAGNDFWGRYFAGIFELSADKICFLLADFQPGGIQAGLKIAMTRAITLQAQKKQQQPEELLDDMHRVFGPDYDGDASKGFPFILLVFENSCRELVVFCRSFSHKLAFSGEPEKIMAVGNLWGDRFAIGKDEHLLLSARSELEKTTGCHQNQASGQNSELAEVAERPGTGQAEFVFCFAGKAAAA